MTVFVTAKNTASPSRRGFPFQYPTAMKQIRIKIICDEGHVADFLRETATEYEMSEKTDMTYETGHGIAEISEEI